MHPGQLWSHSTNFAWLVLSSQQFTQALSPSALEQLLRCRRQLVGISKLGVNVEGDAKQHGYASDFPWEEKVNKKNSDQYTLTASREFHFSAPQSSRRGAVQLPVLKQAPAEPLHTPLCAYSWLLLVPHIVDWSKHFCLIIFCGEYVIFGVTSSWYFWSYKTLVPNCFGL